mgnify:CR=1 FL=1
MESEEKCRKLDEENRSLRVELSTKEKDYDSTLDAYKQDISVLQGEKNSLQNQRQKLLAQNKSSVFERLGVTPGKPACTPGMSFHLFYLTKKSIF